MDADLELYMTMRAEGFARVRDVAKAMTPPRKDPRDLVVQLQEALAATTSEEVDGEKAADIVAAVMGIVSPQELSLEAVKQAMRDATEAYQRCQDEVLLWILCGVRPVADDQAQREAELQWLRRNVSLSMRKAVMDEQDRLNSWTDALKNVGPLLATALRG